MQISEKLKDAINQNKLVLFIGAGCSIPLGFPSWKRLTTEILKELDRKHGKVSLVSFENILNRLEHGSIDIMTAYDSLETNSETRNQYKSEVKQIVNEKIDTIDISKETSPIHSLIWELSSKIITTNYDRVLEKFMPLDKEIKTFENHNKFQSRKSQALEANFLYKIHGDVQNPETIVLFKSDYADLYDYQNHNNDALSSFFKDKTLLFIGFSLTDPFINEVFLNVKKLYGNFSYNTHYAFSIKNEDFSKYDIETILIKNWDEDLLSYMTKLTEVKNKIDSAKISQMAENDSKSLETLNELFKSKVDALKVNPGDTKLYDEIKDIESKIKLLMFGDFNYLQKINPTYRNTELRSLFEKIYSSEILDDDSLDRINKIRNDYENYKFYDRSVLVSAISCSLIHNNKVDETKINLLIDFINDNEDKVWQKAITSLFMVLNHLGNKWLKFQSIKNKLENLKQIPQVQIACFYIIQLFNIGFHKFSFLDENIFLNEYFKNNPFNYFLPFFDDEKNEGFSALFENYHGDMDAALDFFKNSRLPDQIKYLFCNSNVLNELDEVQDSKPSIRAKTVLHYNSFFYPYSMHVHELINFYRYFPEFQHQEKLKSQLKITETPIREYLLNQIEKHKALASHFMKDKQWGQAIINLKGAEKLKPNNVEILVNLANCYHYNKYFEDELKTRMQIETLDENNISNLEGLYWHYEKQKNATKCIQYSDKLISLDSEDDSFWTLKAVALEALGNHRSALEHFQKAVFLNPEVSQNYYSISNLHLYFNELDEALASIQKASDLNHKKLDICNFYGNYYRLKGDYSEALKHVDEGLDIEHEAILLGTKAVIYSALGDEDEFYKYLEQAIKAGAGADRLFPDIKEKYKGIERFEQLLQKYNQVLYSN